MKQNLDALKTDIVDELNRRNFVVFYAATGPEPSPVVHWDTRGRPDFKEFIDVAARLGISLIVFHHWQFTANQVDSVIDDLDASDLSVEEARTYRRRLEDLRDYEGFTCVVELSFQAQGRDFMFHLHTDWFAEFLSISSDIDSAFADDDDEEDPMGGYFSRN